MGVKVLCVVASMAIVSGVASCASNPYSEPRAAWRGEVDAQCLASGSVRLSAYVQPMSPLGGRGSCGLQHPFKVSATANGTVAVTPPATIGCSLPGVFERVHAGETIVFDDGKIGGLIEKVEPERVLVRIIRSGR